MTQLVVDMSYSACLEWFDDWISVDPPVLVDEWDLSHWMADEMKDAIKLFLQHACKSNKRREDAVLILRAIFYEYFLFQHTLAIQNLASNPSSVQRLQQMPQSAQKSSAWHNESLNMLTGHEFGAVCYGTARAYEMVVQKKCATPVIADALAPHSQVVFTYSEEGKLSAFKWGWRFEPVVRDVYQCCFAEGHIDDTLGRIRHPTLPRLAASPDGLITSGPRCGRLVEIKSPITRELTGVIPLEYYCQMQLQAEVCDVEAVDYIEMRFVSIVLKPGEPLPDYSAIMAAKNPWMGKICVLAIKPDGEEQMDPAKYTYAYSELYPSSAEGFAECCAWLPVLENNQIIIEQSIWYVYDLFTKVVLRNRRWWAAVGYPAYVKFWQDVDKARLDGTYDEKPLFLDTSESDEEEGVPLATPKITEVGWEGVSSEEESKGS
jgi:hypothetical protein